MGRGHGSRSYCSRNACRARDSNDSTAFAVSPPSLAIRSTLMRSRYFARNTRSYRSVGSRSSTILAKHHRPSRGGHSPANGRKRPRFQTTHRTAFAMRRHFRTRPNRVARVPATHRGLCHLAPNGAVYRESARPRGNHPKVSGECQTHRDKLGGSLHDKSYGIGTRPTLPGRFLWRKFLSPVANWRRASCLCFA